MHQRNQMRAKTKFSPSPSGKDPTRSAWEISWSLVPVPPNRGPCSTLMIGSGLNARWKGREMVWKNPFV